MTPHFQMSHKSKSQTRSPPSGPCSSLPHTAGKAVALPKITDSAAKKALLKPGSANDWCTNDLEEVRPLCRPQSSVQKQQKQNQKLIPDRCSSCALHTDLGPRGEWRLCACLLHLCLASLPLASCQIRGCSLFSASSLLMKT